MMKSTPFLATSNRCRKTCYWGRTYGWASNRVGAGSLYVPMLLGRQEGSRREKKQMNNRHLDTLLHTKDI
jgi:hypothetical protein